MLSQTISPCASQQHKYEYKFCKIFSVSVRSSCYEQQETNPTKMNLMILLSMMTMFTPQHITSAPVSKGVSRIRRAVFDLIPHVERGKDTKNYDDKNLRWIKH